MNNKVSKAIMFYYDSQNGSYKPIDELSGAENIYKYIPKVELYWFDESTNSYKPLVTDGKLPISGSDGSSFDPAILNDYAKKAYVDDSLSTFATQVGTVYATKSYVTTEIGKIDLSNYATKTDLDNKVDKIAGKTLSTNDYTTADKDKLAGIASSANNYTLPASSSTVLGGVKIQTNSGLEITAGGTLSATTLKNTVDTHVADNVKHITTTERNKWNTVGTVSELSTTNKTDLVKAINEVKSQITTSSGVSTFINIKDYGAKGDGITDDTTAIQNAITYARTNKNVVIFPQGRYKTTGTLTIYTGVILKGLSTEGSIIEYAGTGTAVKFDYDQRDMAIETITIQSTNSATTTIGVLMESNLFCNIDTVRVLDFGIGYKLDGKDKWCATNYMYNPFALRCKTGILLTADEGKQTNHTIVVGGYIVGYSPIQEDTKAVVIEQGDSNKFFGTAVEDYAVGYHFISENAGGNSLISPRVENCTKSYIVEPNTVNTTIIDPFGGIEEADIQSSSIMFLSLEPTFVANNLIWENDKGIKAYSSGRTPWEVFKVTMNDGLEFLAPSYFDSNIEFKIADEVNMHQSELTIKQNEVKIRKYLNHGRTNNLPIADETQRGKEIFVEGSTGKSDKLVVCAKKDDGTYTWKDSLNTVKSPYETSKTILGLGKEFVNWFGDATPITDNYSISVPTIVNQDTAIQLQGLSLSPSLLDKLYIRFYVADKSKLSKITVKASNAVYAEFNRFVVATGWNEIPLNFALGTATNSDNITSLQFQVRGLNVGDNPAVVLHSIGYTNKKNGGATVSLQFDDALSSVYTEAKKILRDNAMVGSIGVIETFVGNAGHMTESQLKEMKMLGWVLFNHTKAHVNMSTYTKQQAKDAVSSTRTYLDTVYGTGIESSYVAYPQGGYNEEVKAGLKELNMVGRALLSRDEILPSINKQETCVFEIGNTTTFDMVRTQIDLAIKHNSHISLLFHKVEATASSTISTTLVILRQIVEYIKTQEDLKALRVVTVEDLARLELL